MKKEDSRLYIFIVIILTSVLLFWKIGTHNLLDWDESRNGVNAYEMYHNGDYVNLYYAHELDTWNAKPPLMIWLVVMCYKTFGFNEFALRLPSAISIILFFVFFFRLVRLYEDDLKAFVCCLVLLSCKAILGPHIGLTGDFDALLLFLLTASTYYFVRCVDFKDRNAIYAAACCMGLAFYTKGTAAFVLAPGMLLYVLVRRKGAYLLKQKKTWLALLLFCVIAASWVVLVALYGKSAAHSYYGSKNSLETMLVYDTWSRLTSTGFEHTYVPDHLFVFTTLDSRLNIWNYLFYLSVATGLFILYKHRKHLLQFIDRDTNSMTLLSICLSAPLFIILTIATNKHDWYLAPIFCYVVFIMVKGMFYITGRWKPFRFLWIGVLLLALCRQFFYIGTLPTDIHTALNKNKYLLHSPAIITVGQPSQSVFLYLEWLNVPLIKVNNTDEVWQYKNDLVVLPKGTAYAMGDFEQLQRFDGNFIMKPQKRY